MHRASEAQERMTALLNCNEGKKMFGWQWWTSKQHWAASRYLLLKTEKHMETRGSPWAEYGKDLLSAEGLSPGIVCSEEAAGSWKESTKINSSSSQGSRSSYKTEFFSLLSPSSGYKHLILIRKSLLASSLEVNAPAVLAGIWGLRKENSDLVSELSSGVRDWFPLG